MEDYNASYSREDLVKAIEEGHVYDYIANHYHEMSTFDLKEVLLAVLGVCYDKCCGDEDEEALMELIREELVERRDFSL